jgi:hypothetical protein
MRLFLRCAVAVALASALSACSGGGVRSNCQRAADCGDLGGRTVQQCVADGDAYMNRLHERAECVKAADLYDQFNACVAGLTCSDRDNWNSFCGTEAGAYLGALSQGNCPVF